MHPMLVSSRLHFLGIDDSVQFSPEFTAAVEAKQIAQQEAQRAAFVVDRARQEKQGIVPLSCLLFDRG
jgi:hypothetical protein